MSLGPEQLPRKVWRSCRLPLACMGCRSAEPMSRVLGLEKTCRSTHGKLKLGTHRTGKLELSILKHQVARQWLQADVRRLFRT